MYRKSVKWTRLTSMNTLSEHLNNKSDITVIMTEQHTTRMHTATATSDFYDINYNYEEFCNTEDAHLNSHLKAAIFYIVFALGLIGNITVLWVLLKSMHVRNMTNLCLLNLALSDLLIVLSLPSWALYVQGHYPEVPAKASAMCKVMAGTYQVGFYSGILFVTLMSVDRYLVIVHAVAVLGAKMMRYGIVASVIIWMISICAALPEAIFAAMVTEDNITSCQRVYPAESAQKWKLFRNFGENTVGLFISLPIITYCYFMVLMVVKKTKNSKKDRAIKLILGIVIVFVIFWVPYNVVVFLKTLTEFGFLASCQPYRHINMAMDWTETIALTHCCVNPVIYAFVGEKFRKCLVNVFSRYLQCVKTYQSTSTQSKFSENETSNTAIFFTSPTKSTQV